MGLAEKLHALTRNERGLLKFEGGEGDDAWSPPLPSFIVPSLHSFILGIVSSAPSHYFTLWIIM